MSGSGSLHSWNLETPEDKSVSDWLHLEESQREDDGAESLPELLETQEQESGQAEETKEEDVKEATDGNREEEDTEESNNCEEKKGKGEEDTRSHAGHERRPSSEEGGNKPEVKEELTENRDDREHQIKEEDRSSETIKDLEEPQQRGEPEEEEKTEVSPANQSTAEEQREQDADLTPADSQSRVNDAPPQKAAEEAEKRPMPPAPKVLSVVARFQCPGHSRSFHEKASPKEPAQNPTTELLWSREKVQTPSSKMKEKSSEEEEEVPLIKVSQLKKRFES